MKNLYPVRNSKVDKNIEQAPLKVSRQFPTEQEEIFSNGLNRREFLAFLAGGATAAVMPSTGCRSELARRRNVGAKRPNIIFIMADDLGPEWLSCYGGQVM